MLPLLSGARWLHLLAMRSMMINDHAVAVVVIVIVARSQRDYVDTAVQDFDLQRLPTALSWSGTYV